MKFLVYLAASAAGQTVTVHVRESVSNVVGAEHQALLEQAVAKRLAELGGHLDKTAGSTSFLSLPPGIHNAIAGYGRGEAPIEFDLSPPEEDVRDILGSIDEVARMHEVRESGESLFMTQQLQ